MGFGNSFSNPLLSFDKSRTKPVSAFMNNRSNISFVAHPVVNALLSNTLDAVFLLDRQLQVQSFNETANQNLQLLRGRSVSIGDLFANYAEKDQEERVRKELELALQGKEIRELKTLVSDSGVVYSTRYEYLPIREEDGQVSGVVVFYRDMTREVLAKEQAKASSSLIDLLFEQNTEGLCVLRPSRGEIKVNKEFLRIFGLEEQVLVSQIRAYFQQTEDLDWIGFSPFKECLDLAIGERKKIHFSVGNSKNRVQALVSKSQMFGPDGGVIILISVQDITDREEQATKEKEGEIQFQTIANHFPNGNITILDKDLNFLSFGGVEYETDLDNFSPQKGLPLRSQYGQNYGDFIEEQVLKAFEGNTEQFELTFVSKTYSIVVTPLTDSEGQICRVMKMAQNVTDEKNARLDAHYRREYLRQIIDVEPNFIYVINREGSVILANKAIASFFGLSVQDFLEQSQECFKTYKWRYEEILEMDEQVFKNLKTITVEEAFFHKETKKMHLFQVTRTPFFSQGNELSILCVGVDITDRVNAENELINQREYLRHILDTNPSLIFVKDNLGRYILVNKAFADFYQSTVEELIGKTDAELPLPSEQIHRFKVSDDAVLNSSDPIHSQEHTINPITGQEAYFVTTKKPLIDTEGNINILGVANNITEQKKHEQELRKSEYLLQQIFDKVADGLLLIESETLRILEANPKALEILGAGQKNEIVGQHIQVIRLVREPSARFWKNLFIQIQADNPVHEAEMLDLSDRPFWGSLATSSFEQESRGRILLRISDISAQKKTEEQIMQALHEKEILIQEIHHRVKNNMAVISSLLQLQTGYIKDPALIDVFRDSQSRIKSMALIHEKLYQSKTLAKVEMDSYIKELTRTLFFTYNSRRIDLKIQTQVDNVYLDINAAVPCGLIINEVISNACKHAFSGRDKGLIDIRFEKKGPQYVLEISDDGVGMPSNVDFSGFKSLGMNLVQALSSQLGAKLEIFTQGGVTIRLAFTEKVKPGRENIQP